MPPRSAAVSFDSLVSRESKPRLFGGGRQALATALAKSLGKKLPRYNQSDRLGAIQQRSQRRVEEVSKCTKSWLGFSQQNAPVSTKLSLGTDGDDASKGAWPAKAWPRTLAGVVSIVESF